MHNSDKEFEKVWESQIGCVNFKSYNTCLETKKSIARFFWRESQKQAIERMVEVIVAGGHAPCPCNKMSDPDCDFLTCNGVVIREIKEEFNIGE